ncbi:MAG: hypothetical protein JWP49_1279 [Phenylobacterium sp.]|nr:hypothetical protein [Phenylobacterium sp.]
MARTMAEVDWEDGAITDDGIAAMRAQIGVSRPTPAWDRDVTLDGVEHFALGIGDDNPLWWDEAHALASRWQGRIAPPCYLYAHFNGPRLRPEDGDSSVETFLPGALGLLAGERWRWRRPARVGERIGADAALVEVTDQPSKFGGRSVAQVERTTLRSVTGEVVAEVDQTIRRFERRATRERRTYLDRPLAAYTAADRARFAAQYDREAEARRGARPRYVEDTPTGEILGPMLKGPLTFTNTVGFLLGIGCPNTPTNRMAAAFLRLHPAQKLVNPASGVADTLKASHFEPAIARAGGLPAGYDLGIARVSWFSHLITDWMGDDGFLEELDVRIRRPNFLGDVTWLAGSVDKRDLENGAVAVAAEATNQLGEVTATATARIILPRRGAA